MIESGRSTACDRTSTSRRYRSSSSMVRRDWLAASRRPRRAAKRGASASVSSPDAARRRTCKTSRSRTSSEPLGQPPQLGLQPFGPSGVHQAAEETQLAPEPPRRRAQPVDPLDVALVHARLVRPDPVEPPLEGLEDDEADGVTGPDPSGARFSPRDGALADTLVRIVAVHPHALSRSIRCVSPCAVASGPDHEWPPRSRGHPSTLAEDEIAHKRSGAPRRG